jgi:hypothetical protein
VKIENCSFEKSSNFIYIEKVRNVEILDSEFHKFDNHGLRLNGCKNISILRCVFDDISKGLSILNCSKCFISKLKSSNCLNFSIECNPSTKLNLNRFIIQNLDLTNCKFLEIKIDKGILRYFSNESFFNFELFDCSNETILQSIFFATASEIIFPIPPLCIICHTPLLDTYFNNCYHSILCSLCFQEQIISQITDITETIFKCPLCSHVPHAVQKFYDFNWIFNDSDSLCLLCCSHSPDFFSNCYLQNAICSHYYVTCNCDSKHDDLYWITHYDRLFKIPQMTITPEHFNFSQL